MAIVVFDNFESHSDGQLITDYNTYSFASFPNAGSSGSGNPSTIWECDTGWLYCDVDSQGRKWGYSGRPIDWPDKYFSRINTRNSSVADQTVSFKYKSADFGVGGYTEEGGDATDVWLRYQTQYWLYIIQFDRTNNGIVAKRKVPTNSNGQWLGPSNNISNKGCYYTLKTDSQQPVHGAGNLFISWSGLTSVLNATSDFGKPSYPNLAHDGTSSGGTTYDFKCTITTYDGGGLFNYVRLQLFRAGVLVGSWTDANDCISPSGGRTFQEDWDNGYFNAVTGYQAAWGFPIYTAGKSGLRADNIQYWIDDFTLESPTQTPPLVPTVVTTAATSITTTAATINATVNPRGTQTDAYFQWGTSSTLSGASTTASTDKGSGTVATTHSANLSGLSQGTTYYYRIVAENDGGTSNGSILSFTTANSPIATTQSANNITQTTATLRGTVDPESASSTGFFRWGTDATLTTYTETSAQDVGSGPNAVNVAQDISGLSAGTTYYFRIGGTNLNGTRLGAIFNFTTESPPVEGEVPTFVATGSVQGLTSVTM